MNIWIVWVVAIAAMAWAVLAGNRMLVGGYLARINAAQERHGALKDVKFGATEFLQGVTGAIQLTVSSLAQFYSDNGKRDNPVIEAMTEVRAR